LRNLKITSLAKEPDKKLGEAVANKLNEEFAKLAAQLRDKVKADMSPLVTETIAKSQALMDQVNAKVDELMKPVLDQILREMETQAQEQMGSMQNMGGMPDLSQLMGSMGAGLSGGGAGPEAPDPNQIIEQVTGQVRAQVQEQSQIQMKVLMPQIEAIVQSIVTPAMPEFERMAQDQAQEMAPELDALIEGRFKEISAEVKSMLPPETQQLSDGEVEALLRKKLEADLKPQITALIESQVQSVIQEQIINRIKNQITENVRAQVGVVNKQVLAAADSILSNINIMALLWGRDQAGNRRVIHFIEQYVLARR
jgi:hypothetical protein